MGTGEIMKNTIFYGDNLIILKKLKPESIDLIYLDPPFNSKRQYNILYKEPNGTVSKAQTLAFDDTWTWSEETQRTYEEIITNPNVGPDVVSAIKAFHEIFGTSDLMSYLVMMTIRLIELRRVLTYRFYLFTLRSNSVSLPKNYHGFYLRIRELPK